MTPRTATAADPAASADSTPGAGPADSTADRVQVGTDEITFRVTSADSAGTLLAADVRLPPGGGPPAMHPHAPAEVYRVLSGELAVDLGRDDGTVERRHAGPGDVVHIGAGRPHTVRNESADDALAYVVFAPAGKMESFVRAAGALAGGGPPSMADGLALAERHGVEMVDGAETHP